MCERERERERERLTKLYIYRVEQISTNYNVCMNVVSEIVLKWNKRFMKQKEVIFNTRGITTELRHGNIFCCVCACVFKWDKTFMKQNDFQHQKNLCRIIPRQCVCE